MQSIPKHQSLKCDYSDLIELGDPHNFGKRVYLKKDKKKIVKPRTCQFESSLLSPNGSLRNQYLLFVTIILNLILQIYSHKYLTIGSIKTIMNVTTLN